MLRLGQTTNGLALFLLLIALTPNVMAQSNDNTKPQGCPLQVAVEQVDQFVDNQSLELSQASGPLLQEMGSISNKATKPGIPIGKQLSLKTSVDLTN